MGCVTSLSRRLGLIERSARAVSIGDRPTTRHADGMALTVGSGAMSCEPSAADASPVSRESESMVSAQSNGRVVGLPLLVRDEVLCE